MATGVYYYYIGAASVFDHYYYLQVKVQKVSVFVLVQHHHLSVLTLAPLYAYTRYYIDF